MQLIPRYLVKNRIDAVLGMAGFVTEFRPVYQRQIKVYKGIDNPIQFRMLNADQKPVALQDQTPKLLAFDQYHNLVLNIDAVSLEDGSQQKQGLFLITITENDLLGISQQYLTYTVILVDSNTQDRSITYSNSHFDAAGVMLVSEAAFPSVRPNITIQQFQQTSFNPDVWTSEAASAEPHINSNEALHTLAIYSNGFVGTLTLQATLNAQLNEGVAWTDIESIEFSGTETEPRLINVTGVFSWFRFVSHSDPQAISQILIRN